MYLNKQEEWISIGAYDVKPKHRMYLNVLDHIIIGDEQKVKPKHRMYLNRINTLGWIKPS